MVIDGLHGGVAHLLAFTAASRGFLLGRLTVVLPETGVHVMLYFCGMLQNVADDIFLEGPPEEVQLAHGGLLNGRLTANLEADALAATEGVKQTLAVGLELAFVLEVYHELFVLQEVTDIVLF